MNVSINGSTRTQTLKLLSMEFALSLLTCKGIKQFKRLVVCEI
jgi:hypothetical protein